MLAYSNSSRKQLPLSLMHIVWEALIDVLYTKSDQGEEIRFLDAMSCGSSLSNSVSTIIIIIKFYYNFHAGGRL